MTYLEHKTTNPKTYFVKENQLQAIDKYFSTNWPNHIVVYIIIVVVLGIARLAGYIELVFYWTALIVSAISVMIVTIRNNRRMRKQIQQWHEEQIREIHKKHQYKLEDIRYWWRHN